MQGVERSDRLATELVGLVLQRRGAREIPRDAVACAEALGRIRAAAGIARIASHDLDACDPDVRARSPRFEGGGLLAGGAEGQERLARDDVFELTPTLVERDRTPVIRPETQRFERRRAVPIGELAAPEPVTGLA